MTRIGKIYHLFNTETGKSYVGQTWDLKRRLRQHQSSNSTCRLLREALSEYGFSKFILTILADIYSQDEMDRAETHFILELDTLSPNGYNLVAQGRGGLPSAETKEKVGRFWRGRKRGPMPAEQKEKVRIAKLGSVPSNKGKKLTNEETRQRLRDSHRGKTIPVETREKMSKSKLGKKKSEETRERMRIAAWLRVAKKREMRNIAKVTTDV